MFQIDVCRTTKGADFVVNTKYVRKRVDFNLFDDIGHGHKIHATLFNMIPPEMERQTSIGGNFDNYRDLDVESTTGSEFSTKGSTLNRRSSFGKNANYLSIGRRSKGGTAAGSSMRFPTLPTAFPKAPSGSSFPMVPESPSLSNSSRTPSEIYQNTGSMEQGNSIERQSSFDLPLPPPPPDSPPPEFPPLDPDFGPDFQPEMKRQETISMLPPPDFD